MDLALSNLQRLICYKPQQLTKQFILIIIMFRPQFYGIQFTNCFTNCLLFCFLAFEAPPLGECRRGRRYFWILPDACVLLPYVPTHIKKGLVPHLSVGGRENKQSFMVLNILILYKKNSHSFKVPSISTKYPIFIHNICV